MPDSGSGSIPGLLARWRSDPSIGANIVEWRQEPERPPRTLPLPANLHPALSAALVASGITSLYSHQMQAWEFAHAGCSFAVIADTAGGKTLAYNLPVLDALLRDPSARALYLFPTKALAQDQLSGLNRLIDGLQTTSPPQIVLPTAAVYDGDTPARHRSLIRGKTTLLITNPDMLHLGILPHHTGWSDFFRSLRFIILDEAHIYRGIFGSHVANVLRRLRRVAAHYGASPQYVLSTATLANPAEFAERLVEVPVKVIEDDGSGRGARHFLFYNPPIVDQSLGLRRSSLQEGVRLAQDALDLGVQTILFGRSRAAVELALSYLRGAPGEFDPKNLADEQIRGYRSGYLPSHRRDIEQGLRSGTVRAVVATNALELGIDIGGLGAAILIGYPGSVVAARQQAGRAGRGMDAALAVLVATADPIDQFLAAHPDYFFHRPVEQALIDPNNLLLLLDHLRCAAFELPINAGDTFGSVPPEILDSLLEVLRTQGSLHRSGNHYYWMSNAYPAQAVSLRAATAESITLQADGANRPVVIGQVDYQSALWMVHPGAIYLHEAETFQVEALDLEARLAHLRRIETDYYTRPRSETAVELIEKLASEPVAGAQKSFGELKVTRKVIGYQKIRWFTHEVLSNHPLDLPSTELLTTGYWLSISDSVVERLRAENLWRNDPNDYGPGWSRITEQVRRRDQYRCQICGRNETDRRHDVHHKIPFRLFLNPLAANRIENLVTLCTNCHRRAEAAVRVRSGMAGLAYVIDHLAPLFLMCDSGDIGVYSEPQSPLDDGRPVVAIYDHAPGGIGLSRRLFDIHAELLRSALDLVTGCPCSDGCPSCIGPGGTGPIGSPIPGELIYGGKRETLALLEALASAW